MSKLEKDQFGNRMKALEAVEAGRRLEASLPVMVRLDGRAFSSFTRGCQKPYDANLIALMQATTMRLVDETNANLGYTQSDEISLVILPTSESEPYFGGRVQKLCSILAATCSVFFNANLMKHGFSEKMKSCPVFDCRVWNVPTLWEAGNTILWRERDATKNSISMAAQSMFSHKSLHGLNGQQKIEKMIKEKNVDWHDYPANFKHGTFFKRETIETPFTTEEIMNLPEKHEARKNPNLLIKRARITELSLPDLNTISNLPEVLFENKPICLK